MSYKSSGIARSTVSLVVVQDHETNFLHAGNVGENFRAENRVLFYLLPFLGSQPASFKQYKVGDAYFAYVVQKPG